MTKTIVFIGGGQIAEALIKGLLQSGNCPFDRIGVVEPNPGRRTYLQETYGVITTDAPDSLLPSCQVLLLAVKPQIMPAVLRNLRGKLGNQLVITVAAGQPLSLYANILGDTVPVIRVMPNLPVLVLEGASALCRNGLVSDEDLALAAGLFGAVGSTEIVEERQMDAVTGLSGSGPAYVFSFIEALIDGGVKTGLDHEVAGRLAVQTLLGAARLLQSSGEHPATLRARVSSPAGATISGQHVLENGAFHGIVMSAVEAATARSTELGNS